MLKKINYLFFIYLLTIFLIKINSFSQNLTEVFDLNYYPDNSVSIKAHKDVKPELFKLENPYRLVIDFPYSVYKPVKKNIDVNNDFIKQIRLGQNTENSVRLTIELKKDIEFEYRSIIEGNFQIITLIPIDNNQVINIDDKKIKENKEKNYLVNLQNNKDSIYIETTRKLDYSTLKENNTLIIKLNETKNKVKNRNIIINPDDFFDEINVSEEKENTIIHISYKNNVNLILNKKDDYKLEIIATAKNKETLSLNIENYDNIDKLSIFNENNKTFKYNIFTLENPSRIVIDIFENFEINNIDSSFIKNSKYIKNMRYGKLQNTDSGVRIVLDVDDNVSYKQDINSNNVLEVSISNAKIKNIQNKPKYTIVIDPGHGGNDPGAIGINGIKEKDITLKVSYFLKDLLTSNGFGVIMARSDDSEILLQPRVDIANLNKADIFVSIHCNATEGQSPMGIETYYRTEQSILLAKFLHKNLINNLPTIDRGIRVRNFYVIKNTIMPSVLIEIGYITNRIEGNRLSTDSYQRDVAKSIFNGIKEYFNYKDKL